MLDPKAFAARVKKARSKAKLSQAELAEAAEVSDETISRIERGVLEPSLSNALRIAEALETSLDRLLEGRPTKKAKVPAKTRALLELVAALKPTAQDALLKFLRSTREAKN